MDEVVANTPEARVGADPALPADDDDAGTPAKRSKSGASPLHAPCPVCGKFFTLRHIESHADRCAQQKFLDTTQATAADLATARPRGAAHPADAPRRTTKKRKEVVRKDWDDEQLGDAPGGPRADSPASGDGEAPPPRPPDPTMDSHVLLGGATMAEVVAAPPAPQAAAVRRSGRVPAPAATQARSFFLDDGSEATQFRLGPVVIAQELPDHLVEHVEHVDDLLRQMPAEAVSITTTKGTIDRKKTAELQQRIQEEEYQLELYSSTRSTSNRPPRNKSRRLPYYDSSTALIDAAEARTRPRLTLRVRVLKDLTFQVDKVSNENDAPVDKDAEASAQGPSSSTEPAAVYYMPPASYDRKLPGVEERLPGLPRRRTTVPRRFADSGEVMDIIENIAAGKISRSSQKKRPRPISRQPTAQDAMDYVERMRNVYKIDQQTIATFVGLLKAYKTKTITGDDVAQQITELLKDYPDLIEDFDKFLPLAKGGKSSRGSAMPATKRAKSKGREDESPANDLLIGDEAVVVEGSYVEDGQYWMSDGNDDGYYSFGGYGGAYHWPYTYDATSGRSQTNDDAPPPPPRVEEPPEPDEHRNDLAPGVFWRPFDYDKNACEPEDEGGFLDDASSDAGDVLMAISPAGDEIIVFADAYDGNPDDEGALMACDPDIEPTNTKAIEEKLTHLEVAEEEGLVALSPSERYVRRPARATGIASPIGAKVKARVEEALKEVVAKSDTLAPAFKNDYERMKELAYEVWERFKFDAYTFDTFASIVLEASRMTRSDPMTAASNMLERLKSLFLTEADDVLDKIIEVQPEAVRSRLNQIRGNWTKH